MRARFGPLLLAWAIALPTGLVLITLLAAWLEPESEAWAHLLRYRFSEYLANTLLLALWVGLIASLLGVGLAWLVCRFDFPGRRWIEIALALPLALPGYIVAFVYVGLLDYAAPLAQWLRGFGLVVPSPRNLLGAGLILGLVLYPYVYLLSRALLLGEGLRCYEAARTLGAGPWRAFAVAVLPAIAPAWIGGVALAMLETLADYGAVSVLGVETITVGIFRLWHGTFNLAAASQLATVLLLLSVLLACAERRVQRPIRMGSALPTVGVRPAPRFAWLAPIPALIVLLFALFIPMAQLTAWAAAHPWPLSELGPVIANTLVVGLAAAAIISLLALALAVAERQSARSPAVSAAVFVAGLGYAVPGAVLAVALLSATAMLRQGFGIGPAAFGSLSLLLLALAVRFLRVGHAAIAAGFARIRPTLSEAARLLGAGAFRRALKVHIPLLAPSLAAALLLSAVEVMKELPATLLLRPFGLDTLAVRVYAHTAEGMWREAAAPALLLVLIALPPAWWLVRRR